jgi:hypothetical protein
MPGQEQAGLGSAERQVAGPDLGQLAGQPVAVQTMALALWAAAEPGPVAWVGLDDDENRPPVFRSYLVAALRRSGVAVPGALPAAARGRPAVRARTRPDRCPPKIASQSDRTSGPGLM